MISYKLNVHSLLLERQSVFCILQVKNFAKEDYFFHT